MLSNEEKELIAQIREVFIKESNLPPEVLRTEEEEERINIEVNKRFKEYIFNKSKLI